LTLLIGYDFKATVKFLNSPQQLALLSQHSPNRTTTVYLCLCQWQWQWLPLLIYQSPFTSSNHHFPLFPHSLALLNRIGASSTPQSLAAVIHLLKYARSFTLTVSRFRWFCYLKCNFYSFFVDFDSWNAIFSKIGGMNVLCSNEIVIRVEIWVECM